MAGAEASAALSPGGAEASLAALFNRGERIATHKNDNVFKELEGRELTAEEQKIISERVALQRSMASEFDKRERARKARSRLLCRTRDWSRTPARRTRAWAGVLAAALPAKTGVSRFARPAAGDQSGGPGRHRRGGHGCTGGQGRHVRDARAPGGLAARSRRLTSERPPPPPSEDEAAIALTDPAYRHHLAAYLRPAAPVGTGAFCHAARRRSAAGG